MGEKMAAGSMRGGRRLRGLRWGARAIAVAAVLFGTLPAQGQGQSPIARLAATSAAGQSDAPAAPAHAPSAGTHAYPAVPAAAPVAVAAAPSAGVAAVVHAASAVTPALYRAFVTPASARPIRAATAADAATLYHVAAETAQPLGPYRTTVTIHSLADLEWLKRQGVTILAVTADSATVLVYRHGLEALARHRLFPDHTDLVTQLQSGAIKRWVAASVRHGSIAGAASPLAPTAADLLAASSDDSDGDGLTNVEESWWCTDPNNPDSNGDGVSDGQEVQNLVDWLQHTRPDRGPGQHKPFSGWPANHPGCYDSDFDSVPDAAETFMLGLNPTLESTARDKYDDGQKLFGYTYCPGASGGGCGYGELPPAEIPFSQLPSWVKAPYDSPFVSAFPAIDVSVVPNTLHMTRVTTITTTKGQMQETQKSYQTAVTNEESDSVANTQTWNNWQEVSHSLSQPASASANSATIAGRAAGSVTANADSGCDTVGLQNLLNLQCYKSTFVTNLGDTLQYAGAITSNVAILASNCVPSADLNFSKDPSADVHVDIKGCVRGIVACAPKVIPQASAIINHQDLIQPPDDYSTINNGCSSSPTNTAPPTSVIDPNDQGLGTAVNGLQYAINQQGQLIANGLHDVAYAISQPRVTTTNTSGQSWGGSQTTTHEVSQAQTVTNGQAFTDGTNWSTATAVDTEHAADLTFSYTISNDGTDFADHVDNLIFNVYLGQDTTPVISWPAWQSFSNGELQNLFPGNSFTYTTTNSNYQSGIPLTLDEMRRIDTGTSIRVVLESYDFGIDQQFYQDALGAGLNVTIDTGEDTNTQPVHSYLLPIQNGQSMQDVLTQFFPATYDSTGRINGLEVPQYDGATPPAWAWHDLTGNSWWHMYFTQPVADNTQLKDLTPQPGSSILIRFDQDSDHDGYPDRTEQHYGTDPNNPASHPAPDLIAGIVITPTTALTAGTPVTATLALENTGTFPAYGIQATMFSPDATTTITDDIVGGNGEVDPGQHVAVGSLIDAPDLSGWSTDSDAAAPVSGGNFTGLTDVTYTFTVAMTGTVGQGDTAMNWTGTDGKSGTLQFGDGYQSPALLSVEQGVYVGLNSGPIDDKTTSFTIVAHAPEDTFHYTINSVPYTPPVVVVTYSDPQGSHRFVTQVTLPTLDTSLAGDDAQMQRNTGVHIVPTGPVTTTASNTTNIILDSPITPTVTGGNVEIDFTSNSTVVKHIEQPETVHPGPMVAPIAWKTSDFSQAYDPTADNILIATWTDAQGNIIDSTARPLNTFAADPAAQFNMPTSFATWNIGTVTQGAILTDTIPIANTGLVPLDIGVTANNDPTHAITGTIALTSVAPLSTYDLPITLDTSGIPPGAVNGMAITISTNDPAHPTTTITITGNVAAPTGQAQAFAVPNHPLDQLVRVYGPQTQYATVAFSPTIQPDPGTIEPCKVYDSTGSNLKGVGQYCTDFSSGTTSAQVFGDGKDDDLPVPSGQSVVADPVMTALSTKAVAGQSTVTVASTVGFSPGDEVLVMQMECGNSPGVYEYATVTGVTSGSPGTLTLQHPLQNTYFAADVTIYLGTNYTGVSAALGCSEAALDQRPTGGAFAQQIHSIKINAGASATVYSTTDYGQADPPSNWRSQTFTSSAADIISNSGIGSAAYSIAITGGGYAQVIRVPHFRNVTVQSGGTLTTTPWNGATGGILVFRASGTVNIQGTIDVSGIGFRGGKRTNANGWQGEGTAGPGNDDGRNVQTGPWWHDPNGNGGGGGQRDSWGAGGGGGGNGAAGSSGTNGNPGPGGGTPGSGGLAIDQTDPLLLVASPGGGGGGGASAGTEDPPQNSYGGAGGGIVLLYANQLAVGGAINANGLPGSSASVNVTGGGGGGAGGTIRITAGQGNLGTNIAALGATGGTGATGEPGGQPLNGGAGGAGRIRVEYCLSIAGSINYPPTIPVKLTCYIASKSDPSTVQFTVPDQVTNGQDYLMQFARHLAFDGTQTGPESNVVRVPTQPYGHATMDVLLDNIGGGGVSGLTVTVGTTRVYTGTGTINQSTTIPAIDITQALNACINAKPTPCGSVSNGTIDVPVQVSLTGQADVLLTNVALTPSSGAALSAANADLKLSCPGTPCTTVTEGNAVSAQITVHNTGSQAAQSVVVGYYAGEPTADGSLPADAALLGSSYLDTVPAGGSSTSTTYTWDTTGFTGTQRLYAVVDPPTTLGLPAAQQVGETANQPVTINSGPDLQVQSITLNPAAPVSGEPVVATVVVANAGQSPAGASTTRLQIGEGSDTFQQDLSTAAIPANGSVTLSAPFTPAIAGTHGITATADISNTVNESDETNNATTAQALVGEAAPPVIDAGAASDAAYSPALGYGYLDGQTYDFGTAGTVGTAASTVRLDGSGTVQYRFDSLQPARAYQFDALLYQNTGIASFTESISFNGVDSGQIVTLDAGVPVTLSVLVPTVALSATVANGTSPLIVTFHRATGGPAFVSALSLSPLRYYVDAGGAGDAPYSPAAGYGYLGTDSYAGTLTAGATDPLNTYRSALGSTVTYRLDDLLAANTYQVDLTMYGGGATQQQSVTIANAGGTQIASCPSVPISTVQHVQCAVPAGTSGSIQVAVLCVTCVGPYVNEIALEQNSPIGQWLTAAAPVSIFTSQTPTSSINSASELGVKFQSTQAGQIVGLRYYKVAGETGSHTGHLWTATGISMGAVTFANETASGWQTAMFSTPIPISANTTYVASVNSNTTWGRTAQGLVTSVSNGPLFTVADGKNGVYSNTKGSFPSLTSGQSPNYFRDVLFVAAGAGSQTAGIQAAAGWNLISLPLASSGTLDGAALLQGMLADSGGKLAALYALTGGAWTPSLVDVGGHLTGGTFPLQDGQGYLLYTDTAATYTETGRPSSAGATWSLARGWNLIGPMTGGADAASILSGVLAAQGGGVVAMYGISGGRWSPALIDQSGSLSGTDFTLSPGQGYLLYVAQALTYSPSTTHRRPGAVRPPIGARGHGSGAQGAPPLPRLPGAGGA